MCPGLGSAQANHGSEDTAQMSGLPLRTNSPKWLQHPRTSRADSQRGHHTREAVSAGMQTSRHASKVSALSSETLKTQKQVWLAHLTTTHVPCVTAADTGRVTANQTPSRLSRRPDIKIIRSIIVFYERFDNCDVVTSVMCAMRENIWLVAWPACYTT